VVDLRRPTERGQQPSRWTDFPGRLIASDEGDRAEGPHVEFLRGGDLSDAGVERYLAGYYRQAPFEPRHLQLFSDAFAELVGGEGAILVHCTAGKDRTGLLAALIQRALGVAHEDVVADYLLTNRAMLTPERRARVAAALTPVIGREPSEAVLLGFMGVSGHHLDIAFAAIEEAGGLPRYLGGLGVDAAGVERLRRRLLV
jgi:protein-tyrosine phosphatase